MKSLLHSSQISSGAMASLRLQSCQLDAISGGLLLGGEVGETSIGRKSNENSTSFRQSICWTKLLVFECSFSLTACWPIRWKRVGCRCAWCIHLWDADEDNGYCETAPAYFFQFTCPFPIPLHFQLVIHVLFAKNLQDFLTIRLMLWISCVWHEFLQKLYLDCSFRLLTFEIFILTHVDHGKVDLIVFCDFLCLLD